MNLETIAKNLKQMATQIESKKGKLTLLGLFLRESSQGLWDIVIAAPWLKAGDLASFRDVASNLNDTLTRDQLKTISRIVILDQGGAVLDAFLHHFKGQKGLIDIHYVAEGGAIIKKAYVIPLKGVTNPAKKKIKVVKPRPKGAI